MRPRMLRSLISASSISARHAFRYESSIDSVEEVSAGSSCSASGDGPMGRSLMFKMLRASDPLPLGLGTVDDGIGGGVCESSCLSNCNVNGLSIGLQLKPWQMNLSNSMGRSR